MMTHKCPTILIVDDSITTRKMILRMLQATGVPIGPVIEACNGREALDMMASRPVSLVLTDLNMPVMDGMEMIKAMRCSEKLGAIPIIVISAQPDEEQIARLKSAGANAYLYKPVTAKSVRETIEPLLLLIEQGAPESNGPFSQDLGNALAEALEAMALINLNMREPIDLDAQGDVRMTSIAFTANRVHGSLSLKAPQAFGDGISVRSSLPSTAENADEALNELANTTCGLFLRRHFGQVKDLTFGLPAMAWSDASLETTNESDWVITKADGFLVAALVTVEESLVGSGK